MAVKLIVDGKEIVAGEGESLLDVCLENDIYIPNLCYLKEMESPPSSCRLCFVQIEGESRPVASCRTVVRDGMVVKTDTDEVRNLQRAGLQLLLSVHRVDCCHCPANKRCELQRMAKFLHVGLKVKRLETILRELPPDLCHPFFRYDPSKCVLCGKCVYVCGKSNGHGLLTFAGRGFDTVVSSFGGEDDDAARRACDPCHACADVCPVGAIFAVEGN